MALALDKENYLLHKLHSLTGVIPVGYYMVQHLVLNSFTIAGPEKFNAVIGFFEAMPKHFLLTLEICMIWIPLLFHAVYGMFIVYRAKPNYFGSVYGWSRNLMYTLQRWSGVFLFFFLILHVSTTTGAKYLGGGAKVVEFDAWYTKLSSPPYLWLVLYILGVATASFHLGSGIWNFCIRWGITVSDKAQNAVQKFSFAFFVVVTLIGWAALGGFLIHGNHSTAATGTTDSGTTQVVGPHHSFVVTR
jgi:succinate dehydrogenase / fumarate reductase cytochrome b subunit